MEPLVSESRNEWESFLSDYSKFVQKYELLLSYLSLARTKLEGLHERLEQHMANSSEALRQVRTTVDRLCEETERQLLESP